MYAQPWKGSRPGQGAPAWAALCGSRALGWMGVGGSPTRAPQIQGGAAAGSAGAGWVWAVWEVVVWPLMGGQVMGLDNFRWAKLQQTSSTYEGFCI